MWPELADLTASGIARSFLAFCDNSEIHSIRFTRVKLSNPDVMDLSKEYTDMPISMEKSPNSNSVVLVGLDKVAG